MANRYHSVADRMAENTIPEPMSGCHLWIGTAHEQGYGLVRVGGRTRRAHRVAWSLRHGPVPASTMVLHSCDNPACVNEQHLHLGDAYSNMREKVARGRDFNRQKTHCPKGHRYTAETTRLIGIAGWRECRTCENARKRAHKAALRAALAPPPEAEKKGGHDGPL